MNDFFSFFKSSHKSLWNAWNHSCWVTGWGKDAFGSNGAFQSILKKVNVPVVDSNNCQTLLRQTKLTSSFVLDRTSFICAGGVAGQDACTVIIIFLILTFVY